jgi:FkbM family methyltransferase
MSAAAKALSAISPSLFEWLYGTRALFRNLGLNPTLKTRFFEGIPAIAPEIYALSPAGIEHHVWLRTGTTDHLVFQQIFLEEQYGCIDANHEPLLILDCGANVGFSSVYFLNRFPRARVIAVEPDSGNAEMCRRNLAPYGERAVVRETAIWSHPALLAVEHGTFRDGREWAVSVREAKPDDAITVQSTDLPSLLGPAAQVDLLKIDIEGSELQLFQHGAERWLPRIRNILIELHGESCEAAVFGALAPYEYRTLNTGEITACLDLRSRMQVVT